jgi:2Fe-2S ferredoxin
MPSIHYIHPDGRRTTVEASPGTSVMEAAIRNNVRGIDAECGGSCSCATCHVYVEPEFFARLPAADEMESELLEGVAAPREVTSRLGCQIPVTAELDGITVRIPVRQS